MTASKAMRCTCTSPYPTRILNFEFSILCSSCAHSRLVVSRCRSVGNSSRFFRTHPASPAGGLLFFEADSPVVPESDKRRIFMTNYAHPESLVSTEWVAQQGKDRNVRNV